MGMSRSNTAEAGADTARHIPFQGDLAGDVPGSGNPGYRSQHTVRSAGIDGRPSLQFVQPPQQRLGHQTTFTQRTVFGRGVAFDAEPFELSDTEDVIPGASTGKQPDLRPPDQFPGQQASMAIQALVDKIKNNKSPAKDVTYINPKPITK